MILRHKTRVIKVGDVFVGGDNPISVQSMTNTKTHDVEATASQINQLAIAGCDIVRVAVNSLDDAKALYEIKKYIKIPVIADIQYDYRLALYAAQYGADGLRLNPGNIGSEDKIKEVVKEANKYNLSIRVGVNSGSLPKDILSKYGEVNECTVVESAERQIQQLNKFDFDNIKVSLKTSDVNLSICSYKLFSEKYDYPLHLGITEAGPAFQGTIKSAIGIGSLLQQGIGDTIRVSLTADPVEEIKAGIEILKSLHLRNNEIDIVSCPTCARTEIDLIPLVKLAEEKLKHIKKPIKVAIMGCPVNGPGEAREADIAISGGKGVGYIFKKGELVRKVKESELLDELLKEVDLI